MRETTSELFPQLGATDHRRHGSRRRVALVSTLVSLPIGLAAAATAYWWPAWQPHLLTRTESLAKADTPPFTIEAAAQPPSEPTPSREPEQQASPDQTSDPLVHAVATTSGEATDASLARQETRAVAPSRSTETMAQSAMPASADHPATPSAETGTTLQETAPDAAQVTTAREPTIATTAAPNLSAETAGKPADHPATPSAETGTTLQETAPDAAQATTAREPTIATTAAPNLSAVTTDQPTLRSPATVQTVSSEATILEHVGDVREMPAVPALPVAAVRPLLERGGAMLARGDIVAARLFYERAAAYGSAEAATSLGKTYDPAFLVGIAATGTVANRGLAASWYRKAAKLGDPEAARRLATMTAGR